VAVLPFRHGRCTSTAVAAPEFTTAGPKIAPLHRVARTRGAAEVLPLQAAAASPREPFRPATDRIPAMSWEDRVCSRLSHRSLQWVLHPAGGLSSLSSLWPPAANMPRRRSSHRDSAAPLGERAGGVHTAVRVRIRRGALRGRRRALSDGWYLYNPDASRHRRGIRGRGLAAERRSVGYPWGSSAARQPATMYRATGRDAREMYFRYSWKASSPWEGHPTGVKRNFFRDRARQHLVWR